MYTHKEQFYIQLSYVRLSQNSHHKQIVVYPWEDIPQKLKMIKILIQQYDESQNIYA